MTDRLRSRERTLPEGFQFGDMRFHGRIAIRYKRQWDIVPNPKPLRMDDWNVIEGEHFASDAERTQVIEGFKEDRNV